MEATVIDKAWLADYLDDFAGHDDRDIATITGSVKALREMVGLAIQGLSHDRLVEALENALNGMDAAHTDVQAEYARFPGPSLEAAEYNLRHAIADTTAALAAARGEGTA